MLQKHIITHDNDNEVRDKISKFLWGSVKQCWFHEKPKPVREINLNVFWWW